MRFRLLVSLGVMGIAATVTPTASAQNDFPTLGFTMSPAAGPPGTRVRFEGDVPVDSPDFDFYQIPDSAYGLEAVDVPTNPPDCNLIVDMRPVHTTVTEQGHVTGSFVVGREGGCFMSDDPERSPEPTHPGVYAVLLSCHACTPAGMFLVTSPALARTGKTTRPIAGAGAALVILGLLLLVVARRPCFASSR